MINIIKNNKIKVLIFGIVMLLAFLFTITMTKAYTIDNEGNLVSENLVNYNEPYYYQGTPTGLSLENCEVGETYTFTTNATLAEIKISYNWSGVEDVNTTTNTLTFTMTNEMVGHGIFVIYGGENITLNANYDYMLVKGTTAIPYEPYGIWYKNAVTTSFQYAFNNAKVSLYNQNNDNLIMNENINLQNNSIFKVQTDLPTIASYLNSYEGDYRYFYIIIELNISINNSIIINCYQDSLDTTITIYNNNTYSETYERLTNNDYIELNNDTKYYTKIKYDGFYAPDYTNMSINLDIKSTNYSFGYNNGYNTGYEEGYNVGSSNGRYDGEEIGYNNGYATGFREGANSSNTLYGMVIRSRRHTNKYIQINI